MSPIPMHIVQACLICVYGMLSPSPSKAVEATELLHAFLGDEYNINYEGVSMLLASGVDPDAPSASGETPLQTVFRYRSQPRGRSGDSESRAMIALLLKYGATLPGAGAKPNPARIAIEGMDQLAWDLLSLKFEERELAVSAGWPLTPAARIELSDRTIGLPPPEGFVRFEGDGLRGILELASRSRLDPSMAAFFIPEGVDATRPTEIKTVAAFISRRDIIDLTNENDELLNAISLANNIHGQFYTAYFNNDRLTLASPTEPAPWRDQTPLDDDAMQVICSAHCHLMPRDPYQLVFFNFYESEGEVGEESMDGLMSRIAAWSLAIKLANPSAGSD